MGMEMRNQTVLFKPVHLCRLLHYKLSKGNSLQNTDLKVLWMNRTQIHFLLIQLDKKKKNISEV